MYGSYDFPDAPSRKLGYRFWLLAITFGSSLLFVLFQGGKLAMALFAVVASLTAYLGLGRWSGIRKANASRTFAQGLQEAHLEAGTSLTVRIDLQIPGVWPIPYVFVKDRLIRRGSGENTFESTLVPDWRRKGTAEYRTPPLRRGYYHFGATECSTEDIFGFFEHKGSLELPHHFYVLPQRTAIREWKQFHQMIKGMHHRSLTTRAVRETTQINGVREYNYGDRLSRIHWNATAKTGTWKSKEFERESLPKTIVVLDRQLKHYADKEQFELAVSIAASLLEYGRSREMAFGLLSVGRDSVFYEPRLSMSHHTTMLHHLIDVEADGSYPLMQVLENRSRLLMPGTFVAIVSPQYGESFLSAVAWLNQRQMTPCHLWVRPRTVIPAETWIRELETKGGFGYQVQALEELSAVLGGRGA